MVLGQPFRCCLCSPGVPKDALGECPWTRAVRDTHPLRSVFRPTQDALGWPDPASRRGGPLRRTESLIRLRPEHPFHEPPRTGLVRVPDSPRLAIPSQPGLTTTVELQLDPRCAACPPEQMPLANLLQPTCCHVLPERTPRSQARGLSPLRLLLPGFCFLLDGGPSFPRKSDCRSAGWPLLAAPALDGRAVGAAPTSRSRITTPGGMPGVPSKSLRRRFGPSASRAIRPSCIPCRPRRFRWHPSFFSEGQGPRTFHTPPRVQFCRPEMPSTNESQRPIPGSHPTPTTWAATGAPTSPPKAQLPTCFHAPTQGALGPSAQRLFAAAPRPHAARQLLQQSVPRARPRAASSPRWTVASHAPGGRPDPLRDEPAELSQVRGHLAFGTASTPTTTTARLGGFTPT
jgi:hypothetical protein